MDKFPLIITLPLTSKVAEGLDVLIPTLCSPLSVILMTSVLSTPNIKGSVLLRVPIARPLVSEPPVEKIKL